ncbi:hypothetical protein KAX17_00575 [Candidatus Bipolaricaulota bacterium]|nr:hypothetical protein [Candidatus Bipolaricaulota bacterium]
MKKALVMTFVLVLGLGVAVSAQSLEGEWAGSVEFDPGAVAFADFLTDFSSDLSVTYKVSSFIFTSETGFDSVGYASQAFSAEATLGAFLFSSEMSFLPRAIWQTDVFHDYNGNLYEDSTWFTGFPDHPQALFPFPTVGPPPFPVDTVTTVDWFQVTMDDWTVESSISLAGVNFGGLFFFEFWGGTVTDETWPIYEYDTTTYQAAVPAVPPALSLVDATPPVNMVEWMPQTGTYTVWDNTGVVNTGAGWRFVISGTLSPVTLTSYTYFNLIEGFAMDDDPDTKSFDRNGEFEITNWADQVVRFTEEYIVIEGLSLGCIEVDAALRITCDNGFEYFSLWFKEIYLLCCGISTDFEIDFSLTEKTVELFPTITTDWVCWEPTLSIDWADNGISGITLDTLAVEVSLNGLTFSAMTAWDGSMGTLDGGTTEDWYFLVPAAAMPAASVVVWFGAPVVPLLPLVPPVLPAPPLPIPCVDQVGSGLYIVDHVSFSNDYYNLFESFTITYEGDSCCGGLFEITVETLFGDRFTETLAEWGYWYETNTVLAVWNLGIGPWGAIGGVAAQGQGVYLDALDALNAVPLLTPPVWYSYGPSVIPGVLPWYPGCGVIPNVPLDIAYSTLIGLGALPPMTYLANPLVPGTWFTDDFYTSNSINQVTDVPSLALFGWAQTSVDVSLGIGSTFTLEFGLDVGAYGWTRASFGFTFSF